MNFTELADAMADYLYRRFRFKLDHPTGCVSVSGMNNSQFTVPLQLSIKLLGELESISTVLALAYWQRSKSC